MNIKDKFETYDAHTARLAELNAEIKKVERERSEVVKAIGIEIAPKRKVLRSGRELTLVARGDTHFFKGASSKDDVVEV